MKKILVVAPHPDDETLGCGGVLLKEKSMGNDLYWIIASCDNVDKDNNVIASEQTPQIQKVSEKYRFKEVYQLPFIAANLDQYGMSEFVSRIGNVIRKIKPEIIYIPYPGDVHSDHKRVFEAAMACTKWFRYPWILSVYAYETLSETDFGINPDNNGFRPNSFVDISDFIEEKITIMKIYESEIGEHPFPRSEKAIVSLATFRGATCGCQAAEAFMLLKEIR